MHHVSGSVSLVSLLPASCSLISFVHCCYSRRRAHEPGQFIFAFEALCLWISFGCLGVVLLVVMVAVAVVVVLVLVAVVLVASVVVVVVAVVVVIVVAVVVAVVWAPMGLNRRPASIQCCESRRRVHGSA